MEDEEITDVKEIRKKIGEATGKLILYIVLYVVVEAVINNLVFPFLQSVVASLPSIPYLTSHTNSTSTSASTPPLARVDNGLRALRVGAEQLYNREQDLSTTQTGATREEELSYF